MPMGEKPIILRLNNISKSYPGVHALDKASISLRSGEIHALIGENGAGKSTLGKIIAGIVQKDYGEIFFAAMKILRTSPSIAKKLGIGVVLQELGLISTLSVWQNIFLAHERLRFRLFVLKHQMNKDSVALLQVLGINYVNPAVKVSSLSLGQQQMVAIARSLTSSPKLLVLDEPTSSLTTFEIEALFKILRRMRDEGLAILYISHRLEEVYKIADVVTILRDGKVIRTSKIKDVSVGKVISIMVGREISEMYPKEICEKGKTILQVSSLTKKGICRNVDLAIRSGEVIGLYGLIGSGRTELAQIIFGLEKQDDGTLEIFGNETQANSPRKSIASGVGFLPENRKEQGLCLNLSICQNVTRASLRRLFPSGILSHAKEKKVTGSYIMNLRIAADTPNKQVILLSGGNQQKVLFAHWMCADSKLLILDEPTRGIDVGAKVEIYRTINSLTRNGAGILLISSDLPEVIAMSDVVYVMHQGELKGPIESKNPEEILYHAIGGDSTDGKRLYQ
jgi:ribose transport system ATP-binding protein